MSWAEQKQMYWDSNQGYPLHLNSVKQIFFLHWNCTITFLWIYYVVSRIKFCLFLLCAKQNNNIVMSFYTSLLDVMISTFQRLINCHNEHLGWMSLQLNPKQRWRLSVWGLQAYYYPLLLNPILGSHSWVHTYCTLQNSLFQ